MAHLQRQDYHLHYETMGLDRDTTALILLNGTLQTTIYWRAIAKELGEHFHVVTYDAQSQGKSGLGSRPLSLSLHGEDLMALIDHLGIGRAYLVGLSHGARLALHFAASAPDRVHGLLLSGIGAGKSIRVRLMVSSWIKVLQSAGLEAMATAALPLMFGENYLRQNEEIFAQIIKATTHRNTASYVEAHLQAMTAYISETIQAPRIPLPTRILSGSEDLLVPPEEAAALASLLAGEHTLIPGVGHSLPAEKPDMFCDIVREFCTGESGSSA